MPISMNNTTLTFNNGTTMTTAATGTVSSVATGNGLSGGTITTTGTLVIACPAFNTVGSYCFSYMNNAGLTVTSGTNYAAGLGVNQAASTLLGDVQNTVSNNLSGTWKWMGSTGGSLNTEVRAISCRVT